mgnify:FL=1
MDAMDTLGRALGEGRLDMAEFDQRCSKVAEAQTHADLEPILGDLPPQPAGGAVERQEVHSGDVFYSGREIMQTRRSGRRMRAGVFWLGTVGALGLTALHPIFLLAIPTLFILLYVMKVGPDSWYTPSLRQLESQRRQEIKMRQLEIESAKAHQQALMRSQRKDQMNQLKSDALDAAQNTLNRFRKP